MILGNLDYHLIFNKFFVILSKWRISFYQNIVLLTQLNRVEFSIERMSLNLVNHRLCPGDIKQSLEVSRFEVCNTDALNFTTKNELFKCFPRVMTIFDIFGIFRVNTCGPRKC